MKLKSMVNLCRFIGLTALLLLFFSTAHAQSSVLVLNTNGNSNTNLDTALSSTFSTVDDWEANTSGTPTLQDLSTYNTVIAYTNQSPNDPAGLGDVLADYVDAGGCVVFSTYSMSNPWAITGRITNTGYSPLTNLGTNGSVSGDLVALVPSDPIFDGVDLNTLSYFNNSNFAYSGLDSGATLIADDGAQHNMIARNASGNVVGMNLFPDDDGDNNADLYTLFVNAAANCTGVVRVPQQTTAIPVNSPYALALLALLLGVLGLVTTRRYT